VSAQLPGISVAEINALSAEYIKDINRDVLIMAPDKDKAGLPNEVTFIGWLKAAEAQQLVAYKDETNSVNLLSVQTVPGKIVSETKDAVVTTLVLSNGCRVILKPTTFKNDDIRFFAFGPGGTSLASDADYQSAANAAGIIGSFGAGNYGPNQLQKFMSGKQVQVQAYISERTQGVVGAAVPKDLETALQLVYARLIAPRLDTGLFRNVISRSRAGLLNRADDPNSVFQDSVSAILGNYNMRRTGPSITKLSQIDLDRSYAFYKERLASPLTFVFVGSFDDSIKSSIEKYIGSLPTAANRDAKDLGIHIPTGKIAKNIYKGTENKATVRLVFSGLFDYNETNKVRLDALKECLELRLLERLREDESGVYSPGVLASASKYPQGRYSFSVVFGCSPANVDKLIASTLDEIQKLKTAGPPQVNIDKYVAEEKRQQELQLKTNNYWLNYLSQQLQDGEALDSFTHDDEQLQKLNTEGLKAAANRYLSGDNYIRLVLLPEKK
jgi:zinc protease